MALGTELLGKVCERMAERLGKVGAFPGKVERVSGEDPDVSGEGRFFCWGSSLVKMAQRMLGGHFAGDGVDTFFRPSPFCGHLPR